MAALPVSKMAAGLLLNELRRRVAVIIEERDALVDCRGCARGSLRFFLGSAAFVPHVRSSQNQPGRISSGRMAGWVVAIQAT